MERLTHFYKALLCHTLKGIVFEHLSFLKPMRILEVCRCRLSIRLYPFCPVIFILSFLINPTFALAETSLEFYGGYQTSPHSVVSGKYSQGSVEENSFVPFKFTAGWKGNSFSMPPYYGLRVTKWNMSRGWGLDFNHSKAYADSATLLKSGFNRLQFTDGLNNLTVHQQRKLKSISGNLIPYYGYGIGMIIPHVEVQSNINSPLTFEYQYGGPTVAINGGFKLPLKKNKFLFAEYKFTASWLDVGLNGGGSLSTRIFTNALNVGLGFEF
mgnify:FL=1